VLYVDKVDKVVNINIYTRNFILEIIVVENYTAFENNILFKRCIKKYIINLVLYLLVQGLRQLKSPKVTIQ